MSDAEKEASRSIIEGIEKQAAEAKKKYKYARAQASEEDGYASVLEQSRFFNAWPKGRLRSHEQAAGKAMRKAYEKKIKKSKEDERTDAVVNAVKDSAKP